MADGEDSPMSMVRGALVRDSMTRSHRMREGEQANTFKPRNRPEGVAVAAVAMDGGRRSSAHAVRALGAVKQRIECMER